MIHQSAHREVAFFRYDRAPAGYRGFYLRPLTSQARTRVADATGGLTRNTCALFKFAAVAGPDPKFDRHRWPRADYERVQFGVGAPEPQSDDQELVLWLSPDDRDGVVEALHSMTFHGEATYPVALPGGGTDQLTLWWERDA